MRRRRELMAMQTHKLDTSPLIDKYDWRWGRGNETGQVSAGWCITEWYKFNPQKTGLVTIVGWIGNDSNQYTFQYHTENSTWRDWFYFNNGNAEGTRNIQNSSGIRLLYEISFSIDMSLLDECYAYVLETGQIFFAGKNSIYYGYTNINDMPSA